MFIVDGRALLIDEGASGVPRKGCLRGKYFITDVGRMADMIC